MKNLIILIVIFSLSRVCLAGQVILWEREDGGVSYNVIVPKSIVEKQNPEVSEMSEQEYIDWVSDKDIPPSGSKLKIIDASEIVADKTFRNAWVLNDGQIDIDLEKAKQIQKERIDLKIDSELKKSAAELVDIEAAGNAPEKAAILEDRSQLRMLKANLSNLIENAQDVESLKLITFEGSE